jgi:hypothetical protein
MTNKTLFLFFVIRRFYILFTRVQPGIYPESNEFSLCFRMLLIIGLSQANFTCTIKFCVFLPTCKA